MTKIDKKRVIIPLFLTALLCLAACSDDNSGQVNGQDPVVIEPGIVNDNKDPDGQEPSPQEPTDEFVDQGEATTIDDLVAAHAKIKSYYFEQTIPYVNGSVSLKVWYADNKMKVVASADGGEINESYYDYDAMKMIYYSPSEGGNAIQMDFNPKGEDAPDNPKDEDYASCTKLGTADIDGQLCYILETDTGDKLWVGTKYGFPLQVEFVDHLGDTYTVAYRNVKINTVTGDEVAVPADLPVYYLGSGANL